MRSESPDTWTLAAVAATGDTEGGLGPPLRCWSGRRRMYEPPTGEAHGNRPHTHQAQALLPVRGRQPPSKAAARRPPVIVVGVVGREAPNAEDIRGRVHDAPEDPVCALDAHKSIGNEGRQTSTTSQEGRLAQMTGQ
ncbi:hypothetical protein ON010_g10872 [Phytophthora cinnamomi]|nr:hypothetical protein ON010_g10872 [Phytophthora cinnamomi]